VLTMILSVRFPAKPGAPAGAYPFAARKDEGGTNV